MGRLSVACVDPVTVEVLRVRLDGEVLSLIDTCVTFPAGALTAEAEVLAVVPLDDLGDGGLVGFVTDVTPFHPVDHAWPDQGPDRGVVTIDGGAVEIVDVVLGATNGHNLLTATNIPVRRGEPGWAFLVVHVIGAEQAVPEVGQKVQLSVDAVRRDALSHGHTACHIAALALNSALADRWRKPIGLDGLGNPNFDQQALAVSRIHPHGAVDVYRLGKSLRKKGFDAAELPVADVADALNATLARWVAAGASIAVECDGTGLTDRRTWVCDLPEGQERIACGGTHPTSLEGVAAITVSLTLEDAELTMETNVTRRS